MQEEPYYQSERGRGGFMMGLLCGTAVGAAVALMFAPKTGSEMREQISSSTDRLKRQAADTYEQASSAASNWVARGRDAVDKGRKAYQDARDTAGGRETPVFGKSSSIPME